MTKAWILAAAVSALLVGVVAVALVSGGGGNGGSRHATPVPVSTPSPAAPAPADPATAATAIQVQEVLTGIISRLQTPAADGQVKAVTPAEIDAQVQAELAKIGLHR